METLKIYNQLKAVPDSALREIQAGRLRGKSDITPQWRYQKLTEVFGPCGFGWKFTVDKQWTESYSNGEVACFVNVSLFVKHEGEWSEAIPGNGGSMFVANEKNGPYVSDESFKMAITDAIGTAAKMIGLASDVYMGLKNKNIPNQTKYPTQNNPAQDEKPWLNKSDFDKAQEYLRNGGKLEVIKAKYRISKEMMENLNQVLNQATK